ncbi:unnamed protein product [Lampetra planeri]
MSVSRLRTPKPADESVRTSSDGLEDRLPPEILRKILSYLGASTLFSLCQVNKLFHQLASENCLWENIYGMLGKNTNWKTKGTDEMRLQKQERAAGYWKCQYLKSLGACDMNKWKRCVRLINRHTGLPRHTEQFLRNYVTWELTVCGRSRLNATFELSWSHYSETSLTLCWIGCDWPDYRQISTFKLHGVRMSGLTCPSLKKRRGWRSLVETVEMDPLSQSMQDLGQDRLVEMKLVKPGVIVGIWKGQHDIAFLMFTIHFHRLVEKSIDGSVGCPYMEPPVSAPFDDIDPEYGLHGYQLHIALHTAASEIMSASFSQLSCRRPQICDGLIQLAVGETELNSPLSGTMTLPWRCEVLQGAVENCCIMSLTLLDEFKNPFWCVSSPVSVTPDDAATFDYDGEHSLIHYQDSDGQMKIRLVWKNQMTFFLRSLVVYVTTSKVNKHFNTDY